jgi:hypothetical protein
MLEKLRALGRGPLVPAQLLAAAPWPPAPFARRELEAGLVAFLDALEAKLARQPAITAADLEVIAGQVEESHLDDLDSEDRELGHVLFEKVGRALGLSRADTPLADLPSMLEQAMKRPSNEPPGLTTTTAHPPARHNAV